MPMSEPRARVVCVGHTALDRVFYVDAWPRGSAKLAAREYRESGGGMAANAAVAVVRLGGAADFWGPSGDDRDASVMAEELVREGVEVSGMLRVPGKRSSVSTVLVDARGERLIVGFRSDALAAAPDPLPWWRVAEAGAVLADVRWPLGAGAVLGRARRAGVTTVLDGDVAPREHLLELVTHAEHVIFSERGLNVFLPGVDAGDALRAALARGARVAGVTQGEHGFVWCARDDASRLHSVPALPVHAVDTTGAGDVFHGAYALALAEGRGVDDAARFACTAASLKCAGMGARASIPSREAVLARLVPGPAA
jgi:sulfofructose kinase